MSEHQQDISSKEYEDMHDDLVWLSGFFDGRDNVRELYYFGHDPGNMRTMLFYLFINHARAMRLTVKTTRNKT